MVNYPNKKKNNHYTSMIEGKHNTAHRGMNLEEDIKGYNADEVDHFLDQVVKDYEAFAGLLNNSYDRIEQLERRLADQKAMIARLEREKALQDDNLRALEDNVSSNVDILKRLSLLEKAVFQNK